MRAIQITEFGGPEVLVLRELDDPEPPQGFVVLDVLAAGVNWADTHQAENSYLAAAELPLVPGGEVVGTTPEGKRVVALLNGGGYAERAIADPSLMWEVPNGVSDAPGGPRGRSPGSQRLAPAAHERPTPRGRERRGLRRRRRRRDHRGPAGQALWSREGDRPRLEPGKARARDAARGGRDRRLQRRQPQGGADRGERGSPPRRDPRDGRRRDLRA